MNTVIRRRRSNATMDATECFSIKDDSGYISSYIYITVYGPIVGETKLEYSLNSGLTWNTLNISQGSAVQLNIGSRKTAIFRGNLTVNSTYVQNAKSQNSKDSTPPLINIESSRNVTLGGNLMSIVKNGFVGARITDYLFCGTFKNCKLSNPSSISNIISKLNRYGTAEGCFLSMFMNCTISNSSPGTITGPTSVSKYSCRWMLCGVNAYQTNINLPATTLAESCYAYMCEQSNIAPSGTFSAVTLAPYCYDHMFYKANVSSTGSMSNWYANVTTPANYSHQYMFSEAVNAEFPSSVYVTNKTAEGSFYGMYLNANFNNEALSGLFTVYCTSNYCCAYMFSGIKNCNSLNLYSSQIANSTSTLGKYCCLEMFSNVLFTSSNYGANWSDCFKSTRLAEGCYKGMFKNSNIVSSAKFPATTLVSKCYEEMFYNCSSVSYIKALFTTTPGTNYTKNWVYGISSSGSFYKNTSATWNVTGVNGIPSGWTVYTTSS